MLSIGFLRLWFPQLMGVRFNLLRDETIHLSLEQLINSAVNVSYYMHVVFTKLAKKVSHAPMRDFRRIGPCSNPIVGGGVLH